MAEIYTEEQLKKMTAEEWIPLFMSQQEKYEKLDRTVQILVEQLADLKRHRFGRSTERIDEIPGQLTIFNQEIGEFCFNEAEALSDENPEESEDKKCKRGVKKKGKRNEDLANLPITVIPHRMTEDDLKDVFGDEPYKRLPDEIQREIVTTRPETHVVEHHIEVYAGIQSETMVKADHPQKLLRNSLVSPSLAAGFLSDKYEKATPYYRIEQSFKADGIPIGRLDMARWTIRLVEKYLNRLYLLIQMMLFHVHVLHADETPFLVNKDGRPAGSKSYMWVYRTGWYSNGPPIVIYEYQKTREADHPLEFLKDFEGICVTDGYEVYHSIEKKRQGLEIAGCWAHARRRYDEAVKAVPEERRGDTLAGKALSMIKLMFEEEDKLKSLNPKDRLKEREEIILPMVNAYFEWVKENYPNVMKGSKTAKGMEYSLNQEKYLRVFLTDGEVPMHNNAAEQAIRPFCIGKKNWEFCDTKSGAKASAVVYSIIETAKANGLRPYYYLNHILSVMAQHQKDQNREYLKDLLPWSDKLPAECFKATGVHQ